MSSTKAQKTFFAHVDAAVKLAKATEADAILVLLEKPVTWTRLQKKVAPIGPVIVATHSEKVLESTKKAEIYSVGLDMPEISVQNQISQAILSSVAADLIQSGSAVVAIYSGFDTEEIDTISVLRLSERLGRLTARDLKKLETKVPLDTLRVVVDTAVAIGREGREGKAVGTMFIVGDHKKVLKESRPGGFDMVKGYTAKERSMFDPKTREGVKELAQLDGMFVVNADGTVEGAARIIDTSPVEITMTKGLGSRHFSGAAISKNTEAIAVVVSQSSGTVRIFQNGEVVLRIEPMQRAMKWKETAEPTS